jgi:exonuclease SbcC
MIESIELNNFISYKSETIKLDGGITALIGNNGAGKSSILDAVMFSFFGESGRDVNLSDLQRIGENQMYTKTTFKIKGERYSAFRHYLNGKPKKIELQDESGDLIAKDATAVKQKISELINLDHSTFKIATVVPLKDLQSIVSEGKVFRELIDKVLGAEKFKKLDRILNEGKNEFKEYLKENYQNSYEDVERLEREFEGKEGEIKESIPRRNELEKNKINLQDKICKLQKEIDDDKEKEIKLKELENLKKDLVSYVNDAIKRDRNQLQKEVDIDKRKVKECAGCFSIVNNKERIDKEISDYNTELRTILKDLGQDEKEKIRYEQQSEFANRLELRDGKCPVCDSPVDKLKPLYQKEHVKEKIKTLSKKIIILKNKQFKLEDSIKTLTDKHNEAENANVKLKTHNISTEIELEQIAKTNKEKIQKIREMPVTINSEQLLEAATIDSHAKMKYKKILEIEQKSQGFDHNEFREKKDALTKNREKREDIINKLGQISNKITSAEKRIEDLKPIIKEIKLASGFISEIGKIKDGIFSEKSNTFVGLRYSALRKISEKASSYMRILGTNVRRVTLKEINKTIVTECDTIEGPRVLGSFSTGEQRCVALAIRLAMSEMMARTPLKTIMLDEPTANLDQERCDMFLEALHKLSNSLNQNFQFIIATNQEELWTNAKIGTLYKLENPNNSGTTITRFN